MNSSTSSTKDRETKRQCLKGVSIGRGALLPLIVAMGMALSGCQIQNTPTLSSDDPDEVIYKARFEEMLKSVSRGGGLNAYDPVEPVVGADLVTSFDNADSLLEFDDGVISQAIDYSAARNSSSFIVWRGDRLLVERYFGDANQSSELVSKSLAKPLTAILIGRAIKDGYIASLDQPAADFLEEWRADPERSKITLRQLLSMRSGLLPQGFAVDADDVLMRAYLHPRHDDVIINDYPLTHEPGSRYEYSNANSELIAPIIERATGMRYGRYISEALLQPLGAAGGEVWVNREGGTAHAGCCIMLPARTWLKMAILLLEDGVWDDERLLPEGYVDEMRRASDLNPHHGLGVWIAGPYKEWRGSAHPSVEIGRTYHGEPYLDKDLFLFDGNSNQVVYMIPSLDMVILRMGGDVPEDKAWDNSVLPNLFIESAVASGEIAAPAAQLGP